MLSQQPEADPKQTPTQMCKAGSSGLHKLKEDRTASQDKRMWEIPSRAILPADSRVLEHE